MKALIINSVCGVGSTGKICQELYWKLKKTGWECKVAWGRKNGSDIPENDLIRIGTCVDYYIHAAMARIFDCTGFMSVIATKKLIKKIVDYDPDIIHIHNLHGYYINIKILFNYLRKNKKKVVWTMHDCWGITGHCAHFDYCKCNKWTSICFGCEQKKQYPKSFLLDQSKYNYIKKREIFTSIIDNLTIVTPSYWLKGKILKSYFHSVKDVIVIHNGININIFKLQNKCELDQLREQYQLNGKKIILGVAYSWSDRKGVKDFKYLASKLSNTHWKIVLIGITQDEKKQMPESILCINKTNSAVELAKWYALAEVFVNPTYEEVLGLTNLEAQACGTSCITYNTGGCPECMIEDCGNVIVEKGNQEQLLSEIKKFQKKSPSTVANNFKNYYDNSFAEKYIDVYNKAIK